MKPFQGLLKKDFRISRVLFLTWLGAVILMMVFGLGLSAYTSQPAGTFPVIVVISFAHIAFAPVMMFAFLTIEAKNQLWLYSPRRGTTLLLSKLAVIFSYQLITQILLTLFAVISLFWFGRSAYEQIGISNFVETMAIINLILIGFGLYFTCWFTFLWTVYQALKRNTKTLPFRLFITIIIMMAYNLLETLVIRIEALKEFVLQYKIEIFSNGYLNYENGNWRAILDTTEIPIIPLIYYALLTIVLFLVAARILERKVEV
jgi:hypothetical protein